jgi:hypothetical protein
MMEVLRSRYIRDSLRPPPRCESKTPGQYR